MKVLLSGSTGLIGSSLASELKSKGWEIVRLVREGKSRDPSDIPWNPESGVFDPAQLKGISAVIHLAGEPIAGRWTSAKMDAIRDSRVLSTALLSRAIAAAEARPEIFLCASAVGYYGNRGAQILTEGSEQGTGFLPGVCQEWEAATHPASAAGVRVVNLRFGVVLSPKGGALKQMLPAFKFGVGGRLGPGDQYMSWIALEDAVAAIVFLLLADKQNGPVNITSPHPVTNAEFTRALGRAVDRPALLPVPGFALRLLFGQMADDALLASARVVPARLSDAGFKFKHAELGVALEQMLA